MLKKILFIILILPSVGFSQKSLEKRVEQLELLVDSLNKELQTVKEHVSYGNQTAMTVARLGLELNRNVFYYGLVDFKFNKDKDKIVYTFSGYFGTDNLQALLQNRTQGIRVIRENIEHAMDIIRSANGAYDDKTNEIIIEIIDNANQDILAVYDSDTSESLKIRIDGVMVDVGSK